MSESLVDKDMFVIGGETAEDGSRPVGGTYFHVSQDKSNLEESYNVSMRGDINDTDYVEYRKNVDEDDGFVTYDVDAFSADGEYIMTGELDEDEVREIFDGKLSFIADGILSGDDSGRIDDCQYILAQDMGDDVLGAAKRIANGGPSAYLLTDGEFIYLPDHIQISSIPGMTVDKFVGLGNIRLGHNSIEIIQTPNEHQINALYRWARSCDGTVYVDIAKGSGGAYPKVINSFSSEPNHVVNDLLRYFNILDECYDIIKENETQKLPSSLRIMLLDYSDEIWNTAVHNAHLREGRGDTYVMFDGETINLIFTLSEEFFRGETKYAVEMADEMLGEIDVDDKFKVEAVSSLEVPSNGEVFNLDRNQYTERAVSLDESRQLLKEYLDKNYNAPLVNYFRFWDKAGDEEKAQDYAYREPYLVRRFTTEECCDQMIEMGYDEEQIDEIENCGGWDDDYVEEMLEVLKKCGKCRSFVEFAYYRMDWDYQPTWAIMDYLRPVKNEWCIHFSDYAEDIARNGFRYGTYDIDSLAYTRRRADGSEGYDFAFLADETKLNEHYGNEAVLFRTSGVLALHHGDQERQVIFWGPYAHDFIYIFYDRETGNWAIPKDMDRYDILYEGNIHEVIEWVERNWFQYRKKLVNYGTRFSKVNEEVVADGSADHNPYAETWKIERADLKDFLSKYGKLMTSRENGKTYKVYYDKVMSELIGHNYCVCIQYDQLQMKPTSSVVYLRALDKFTDRIFQAQFDDRGRDNMRGTSDDVNYAYPRY